MRVDQSYELLRYRSRHDYKPKIGDLVVWRRWLSTWYGVIRAYDDEHQMVEILFENSFWLLTSLGESEIEDNCVTITRDELATNKSISIIAHNPENMTILI